MISSVVDWWDRRQIVLYVGAIAVGATVGLVAPGIAPALEQSIEPVLILLLFATFLSVPLVEVGRSFRDARFLVTVLVANFAVVPLIAWGLSRFVADDRGLLLGVLFVLLTPCIDYVIVFTGLAGGARARLLAAAPLLMLVQILFLPVFLLLFAGGEVLGVIDVGPFAEAFLLLIVLPLAGAASARLDVPSMRAVIFSTGTRNSLVVLPLALALPESLRLAPLAVVTQTLVALVVLVRVVPLLARDRSMS